MTTRPFALGRARALAPNAQPEPLALPAHHFSTHGVVVGMTGSGKTGLAFVLVEEALRAKVPVLMVDVKGDLANLLLTFPNLAAEEFAPWVDAEAAARAGQSPEQVAAALAAKWSEGLATWGLGAADVAALKGGIAPRVITPGSTAAEPLHVLSALETPSALWQSDEESARESLSASISVLLRLIERDADPARSREHVVLAHLAERRLREGRPAGLSELLADLASPPIKSIGALGIDSFLPPRDRAALAQALNTLLASPTFASWRQGASLEIGEWLRARDGKTPAVIVSVAHLDDAERLLVLGLLFDQLLAWVRTLPGTSELRALVLFDEVYGFLPPHPANPPTKRPLLALLKQARAFGVGVVLATQNPMDLDYKALSNAGVWFVGRLQTDADRERVVEGLAGSDAGAAGLDPGALAATLKSLPPRTFFLRDVHRTPSSALLETRWTLSWLRGPLTRHELRKLAPRPAATSAPAPAASATPFGPAAATPSTPAPAPPAVASAPVAAPPVAATAAPAPFTAPATPPPTAAATNASPAPDAPRVPDGWRTYYGPAPAAPPSRWQYTPWVVATITAHVRDAKLGVTVNRTRTVAAPLSTDGRPDTTRAVDIDRARLGAAPVAGARYAPLPEALAKKAAAQAAERALREHVYRSLEVPVLAHRAFKLVATEGEPREAFLARCRTEAARRAALEVAELTAAHAPRVTRATDRVAIARADLTRAEAQPAVGGGGVLQVAILGAVGGKRAAQKALSARDKANAQLHRARRALADAEAAARQAVAARDAEVLAAAREMERAGEQVETVVLRAKKGDLEVTEIGVGWASS